MEAPMLVGKAGMDTRDESQLRIERNGPTRPFWMLSILTLAAIVPFWTVQYPVMADYPNHLARWFVLFHMRDGFYHFQDLYAPAWGLLPYISPDVLAMALQYFLPIAAVGKCILSLGVILVSFATYFLLKQACPENLALSSFGILVAFNPNFLMGSISYQYSIAFCLLVVGLWVNFCKAPRVITAFGIVFGLILVYLSHLTGFFVAGFVMGVYTLFQDRRWKKMAILAMLSLPALLIFVHNPIHAGGSASLMYAGLTPLVKLKSLVYPVRIYTSKKFDYIVLLGLAVLVFLVPKKKLTSALQPAWLAVCASLLLVYFVSPTRYGLAGDDMDVRLMAFVYLFLLAVPRFRRVPRYLYIGLALLVLFRVSTVEYLFISHQGQLKQLTASFEAIPRNASVVPLVLFPGNINGRGDIHHLENGVIERGFLDPVLFHLEGVQPIRLTGSSYCPNIYCDPANATEVDWQQVAKSYDYLWVYDDPEITAFTSRIADVIYSNGTVTIYRVRHPQH
jgi:hypothetical protein